MHDYECYICLVKPVVADIMSSWMSEARVNLTLLPASSRPHTPVPCPVPSAPRTASLSRQASHSLELDLGVYIEILSMCQLLLRQT